MAKSSLPGDLTDYFTSTERVVPLADLRCTRSRAGAAERATDKMRAAARGDIARRAPVDVRQTLAGFDVVEGNATVAAARAAGWVWIAVRFVA